MQNNLQMPIHRLLTLGGDAASGVELHGGTLGINRNTPELIRADVAAAELGRDNYEVAAEALRDLNGELRELNNEAIAFATLARDLLKPVLGKRYSAAWNQTGLVGSLKIPRNHEDIQGLMLSMKTALTNNPTWANAPRNITAARAEELREAISNKRAAILAQETVVKNMKLARDLNVALLAKRMRLLITEIGERIGPLDPHWLSFGLNMPGARLRPDMPKNLLVALVGSDGISVKWERAARANHYRVWKKVIGVDADFVIAGSPADLDFTIQGLPSNATVEIVISAMNESGESARSEVLSVVTQ